MNDFVPLFAEPAAKSNGPRAFAALAPQATIQAHSPQISGDSMGAGQLAVVADAPAPAEPCPDAPSVTLVRENDQVVRIVVQCACGRKLELDCLY